MQSIFWSVEEVAYRAKQFHESGIRQSVESGGNIGQMIVIVAETGEHGTEPTGAETASQRKRKNPNVRLFTLRIGHDVAASFGARWSVLLNNLGKGNRGESHHSSGFSFNFATQNFLRFCR